MTLPMIAYVVAAIAGAGGVALVYQVWSKAPPKRRLAAMIPWLAPCVIGLGGIASEATAPVSEAFIWASGVAVGAMIGAVVALRMLAGAHAGGVTQ